MLRTPFLVSLLLLAGVADSLAQTAAPPAARAGAWTARSSTGLTLAGTWTAKVDPTTGAVSGTWTLGDPKAPPRAQGFWSAAKSPAGWSGGWRAVVTGRKGEYSGTWAARLDLKPDARFAEMLEKAVQAAVAGTWKAASQSGSWSIRASN